MLELKNETYKVTMINDSAYISGSADNSRAYDKEIVLGETDWYMPSKHGIVAQGHEAKSHSAILLASGGATGVHAHSALLHGDLCIAAAGSFMCCLRLPTLNLEWNVQPDDVTCFGVYHAPSCSCYISHGELEIARISYSGEIVWRASGKEIFTNGFVLHEDYIEAVDFNDERYRIEIETGRCKLYEV
jgi:hypothetical protein